ncbi:hypothetical protein [Dactylosporangium sp. NPDC005555]|uniref:hypothetical protein n=1 Tax=Dactylosporangium sp. NPDC005555 TaxID=3154889 RepID=UPI0033B865D1
MNIADENWPVEGAYKTFVEKFLRRLNTADVNCVFDLTAHDIWTEKRCHLSMDHAHEDRGIDETGSRTNIGE